MVGQQERGSKVKQQRVTFPCGKLILEGVYYTPDEAGNSPCIVLCHPHPLYGGNMNNNVITALAAQLADQNMCSLAFNFRGVGQSQGGFGNGIGEIDDARAAIDWLVKQPDADKEKAGMAGYSFGASVALPAACTDKRIKGLVLISPALHEQHRAHLRQCIIPKLIISGSSDDIVPVDAVKRFEREAAEPKECQIVSGADHFWWGAHESVMAEKTASFFRSLFGAP